MPFKDTQLTSIVKISKETGHSLEYLKSLQKSGKVYGVVTDTDILLDHSLLAPRRKIKRTRTLKRICSWCNTEFYRGGAERANDFCGKECKLNFYPIRRAQLSNRKDKPCSKCKDIKNIEEFAKRKTSIDGYSTVCKDCMNILWVCSAYNITEVEYKQLLKLQAGRCAICNGPPEIRSYLYVDHSHDTGEVRGLLCHSCNLGLSNFKDNKQVIEKSIIYLDNPPIKKIRTSP